jgi:hypothetical protein
VSPGFDADNVSMGSVRTTLAGMTPRTPKRFWPKSRIAFAPSPAYPQ